jgi:hypothetical protein
VPKTVSTLIAVLAVVLVVNVVALFNIGGALFVTYADAVPKDISCQGCDAPQVQAALARAASAGRSQIQSRGESALWWAVALIVVNLAAPVIVWRLHRGKGPV